MIRTRIMNKIITSSTTNKIRTSITEDNTTRISITNKTTTSKTTTTKTSSKMIRESIKAMEETNMTTTRTTMMANSIDVHY